MRTRKKKTKRTRRKKKTKKTRNNETLKTRKKNAGNDKHMDKGKENVINHSHTVFILVVVLQNTSTGKRV